MFNPVKLVASQWVWVPAQCDAYTTASKWAARDSLTHLDLAGESLYFTYLACSTLICIYDVTHRIDKARSRTSHLQWRFRNTIYKKTNLQVPSNDSKCHSLVYVYYTYHNLYYIYND